MSGVISGQVVDANGAPVSGASVAVISSRVRVSYIAAPTDAGGKFRRSGLATGDYALEVHKTGLPSRTLHVRVVEGQQVNVEVQLDG
jgi:hypothetical protein